MSNTGNSLSAKIGFVGNNIHGGNFNFADGNDGTVRQRVCMTALFVCKKKDEREKVITRKGEPPKVEVCQWVIETQEFTSWLDSPQKSSMLWIRGGSGTGKTMLSIYISQRLEQRNLPATEALVVYHFCDTLTPEYKTAVCILRNLVWEMCHNWQQLYKEYLEQEYIDQGENLFKAHSMESLWRVFTAMLKGLKGKVIYLVVDGLDVLSQENDDLKYFLRKLTTYLRTELSIAQNASCMVKILLVSRQSPPAFLEVELADVSHLDLDRSKYPGYAKAIQTYTELQFSKTALSHQMGPEEKQTTLQALEQRQDTSFIPANHIFQHISDSQLSHSEQIAKFPNDLNDIYLQALEAIPVEQRNIIANIFTWTLALVQPLSVLQMCDGLLHGAGPLWSQVYCASNLQILLRICDAFLTLSDDGIQFKHQSATDFLLSESWRHAGTAHLSMFYLSVPYVHTLLANACIRYLADNQVLKSSIDLSRPSDSDAFYLTQHSFLSYAIRYWMEHARMANLDARAYDIPFFEPKSKSLQWWWESFAMSKSDRGWNWVVVKDFSLLHIASCFGLVGLAENLSNRGLLPVLINSEDSDGCPPLEYAIRYSHLQMVIFLLSHGAAIVDSRDDGLSQLHYAASLGNIEIFYQICIYGKIGVDFQAISYGFKDIKAWRNVLRHPKMLSTALFNQGSVDSSLVPPEGSWSVLQSWTGKNVRPLHFAAGQGHEGMTQYLLSNGAHPTSASSLGMTPLHFAASKGQKHILQLLIEFHRGREILNAADSNGWTPLHFAANHTKFEAVSYLTQVNANINAINTKLKTPLHIAVQIRRIDNARVLLQGGANTEAVDHKGRTPLAHARDRYGSAFTDDDQRVEIASVIQLLIDHGASPNHPDRKGKTIRDKAVADNQTDLVAIFDHGPRNPEEQAADNATEQDNIESEAFQEKEDIIPPQSFVPAEHVVSHSLTSLPINGNENNDDTDPVDDEMLNKISALSTLFHDDLRIACREYIEKPPVNPLQRRTMYTKLSDRLTSEILEPLDAMEVPQDSNSDVVRKQLDKRCNKLLQDLDKAFLSAKSSKIKGT